MFAGYVSLASQSPYPIIVYSVARYRLHLSRFWPNMKFLRSQLIVTFHLCMYLTLSKEHLLFTYSTNILARLLTTNTPCMKSTLPQKSENV